MPVYCYEEGHWKNERPNGLRTPRRPSQPEAEAKLLKESISLLRGEAVLGRKMSLDWPILRIVRKTRTDWAPFYWAPRRLWSE
jgi:hypothetical protein